MIINSRLARKHATAGDPWATEYLHRNPAGSGAFKVARWDPGQQIVYERNDKWTSGPLPGVPAVILNLICKPLIRVCISAICSFRSFSVFSLAIKSSCSASLASSDSMARLDHWWR